MSSPAGVMRTVIGMNFPCLRAKTSPCQVPIAGSFCNGEIGPVAGSTHLHGYTASLAFLVPRGEG